MAASFAGIHLHPHGALLLAADEHLGDAGNLRNLLRQDGVGVVVDLDQRHGVGLHRQDHDRRVGRVDLPIGRRRRQVLRQLARGGVDRRLHVTGGGVDVALQIELHGDLGRAEHADRGELSDAGDLGELILQRLRHRARHGLRAGAGELRLTEIVGKSTRGSGATGSSGYAAMPTSTNAAMSSDVAIGRRMKGVEMLMPPSVPLRQPPGLACAAACCDASFAATRVPSCKRDWPSVTTGWPSLSPLAITASPVSRVRPPAAAPP